MAEAICEFDAVTIGPGSFYTSLMPIFLVRGVADALETMKGPVILIANLLTEGRGMSGFTAADAVSRIEEAIQRPVDVVITNMKWPTSKVLGRYKLEHKEPLAPGKLPAHCELVGGEFWKGDDRAPRSTAARVRGLERALAPAALRFERRHEVTKTSFSWRWLSFVILRELFVPS